MTPVALCKRELIVSVLASACLSCACSPAPSAAPPANVVRIAVLGDGRIVADGREVDAAELDGMLARAAEASGAVWYYREGAGQDPTTEADIAIRSALETVMRHRLPISLSTRPDFSDVVDESGRSHPRQKAGSAN